MNKTWQSVDVWEPVILKYLAGKDVCTVGDILLKALSISPEKQGKLEQMRVAETLRMNNWSKARNAKLIDGVSQR